MPPRPLRVYKFFLTLSVPNFRRLSPAFLFNKLSLEKKFMRKVERRNEPSHLDLCCLRKLIIIACGSERVKLKEV